MDDFYFISASIIAALVVTGVPVRYYLQVTGSLSREKRLYQLRDKLKLMPVLAVSGVFLFFLSLSQGSNTGAYIACAVTGASVSISVISVLVALTSPQCRRKSSHTLEAKVLGLVIAGVISFMTFLKTIYLHALRERNSVPVVNGEKDIYRETHNFERSQGLLDDYGRYKD